MKSTILIVDDDPVQRRLLQASVNRMGHEAVLMDGGQAALNWLAEHQSDLPAAMLLDLVMPEVDGLQVMQQLNRQEIDVPVIVQTARGSIDAAVSAMREGAFDFCVKPAAHERLEKALSDALRVEARQTRMKNSPGKARRARDADLVGNSEQIKRVHQLISKAASSDIPVLIEGESGTGKELIARALQAQSERHSKPFVIVNCGAIPDNLVESILFGHEKGAFTGATEKHVGKFVEADGGTLFLDEIGDLPLDAQVKVLRAIQDGEVEPVGARGVRKVSVRLISATNRDLIAAVRNNQFREDLYYRLNVFPIMVPPLRYRKEDVPALVSHFIRGFERSNGFPARHIDPHALALLIHHDWPGNIRQLQNAVFRAMVLCEEDTLTLEHFPQIATQVHGIDLSGIAPVAPTLEAEQALPDLTKLPTDLLAGQTSTDEFDPTAHLDLFDGQQHIRSLSEIEGEIIARAIDHYQGRMSEVARRLGIGRSTLYRKLKEHDIEPV